MLMKWKEQVTYASGAFKRLWGDQDFADVTLATADDRQIKAHRVIIGECSPFFRNILVKNPHPNALIYLKGITYTHLENALKFIYLGQCEVRDYDIKDFLAAGADLGITGLVEMHGDSYRKKEIPNNWPNMSHHPNPSHKHHDMSTTPLTTDAEKTKPPQKDQNLLSQPAQDYTRAEELTTADPPEDEEMGQLVDLALGVQKDVVRFQCDMCDKEYARQKYLTEHKLVIHEGVRFECDQCDYKANRSVNLNAHIHIKHNGRRYSCDECDYQSTQSGNLTTHKRFKHEGVRYSCDQCGHKATTKSNLNAHTRAQHEGVCEMCHQCGSQFMDKGCLNRHKRRMHQHTD
jgi:hypothetical protein